MVCEGLFVQFVGMSEYGQSLDWTTRIVRDDGGLLTVEYDPLPGVEVRIHSWRYKKNPHVVKMLAMATRV